jgi:hypothetical protein
LTSCLYWEFLTNRDLIFLTTRLSSTVMFTVKYGSSRCLGVFEYLPSRHLHTLRVSFSWHLSLRVVISSQFLVVPVPGTFHRKFFYFLLTRTYYTGTAFFSKNKFWWVLSPFPPHGILQKLHFVLSFAAFPSDFRMVFTGTPHVPFSRSFLPHSVLFHFLFLSPPPPQPFQMRTANAHTFPEETGGGGCSLRCTSDIFDWLLLVISGVLVVWQFVLLKMYKFIL